MKETKTKIIFLATIFFGLFGLAKSSLAAPLAEVTVDKF
jgi:hypothetical protein